MANVPNVKGKIWFAITVVFAVCLTIYTLSYLVTNPWHVISDLGGDGSKNNFTYLYQSMYGKGYWFDGMNYPYGEHILYTDGQPLLSVLFTGLNNVTTGTALTVMWVLIGLSYVLAVIYLYLILTHFKVTPFIAILFAGLITIFSPQLFCIASHYALAYICVIPMLFYWTIKYHERPLWRYSTYIFVFGVIMSFLHLYFAAIILIWVVFYSAAYFIFTGEKLILKIKHIAPVLVSVFALLAVVSITIQLTDPVKDRPVTPYGMLVYLTGKKDIITSIYSPVWKYIIDQPPYKNLLKYISSGGEGYDYIGLVVIGVLFISLALGVFYKYKKNISGIIVKKDGFSPVWLFMAFGVLLFSMGVPYVWHMEWILDYLTFLRQFRTLGRFSWMFYYIITVYATVVIYTWYTRLKTKRFFFAGYAILLIALALWGYEASGYIKFSRERATISMSNYDILFSKNEQNWISFLQEHHCNKNDFQALLLLPFFHVGTEKLWLDGDWVTTMGYRASLQLQLPIVDVMMSRSSWSEAEKQVKIAAGPYAGKPILDDIKSNKPFLLLQLDIDSLNMDQKYLLQASDYIGHYSQCYIYAFYPDRLRALAKKKADSINAILPYMHTEDSCIEDKGSWYVEHFDMQHGKEHLFGTGAMSCIQNDDSIIATIPVNIKGDSQLYEFSCWFLLSDQNPRSPDVSLQMIGAKGEIDTAYTINSVDNYGLWFRNSKYLYIYKNTTAVKCRFINFPNPAFIAADEMMFRPADAIIISKSADGSVMVNNHLFKKADGRAAR